MNSMYLGRLLLLLVALPLWAQPRNVIVEFAPSIAAADVHAQLRRDLAGVHTAAVPEGAAVVHDYYRTLSGAAVRGASDATVVRLRALPYVRAVHEDTIVTEFATPAAAGSAPRIGVNSGGAGVVVAILDSGIDYRHAAFGNGFGSGRKVAGGWDFVNRDADPMDDRGHGTHVAGIVAGNGGGVTGVAPEATLLAYKVLDNQGQGSASDIIAAVERALDPDGDGNPSDRVGVINLSLGGPGGVESPLSRAVDAAVAAGVVVCAAAGNSGEYYDVGSPGSARDAITVGAVHATGELAEFSTRGPGVGSLAVKPEVLAPGVAISSAALGGGTVNRSGTSMASPYVAGIAARLIEAHPDWSAARVKSAIVNSATPTAEDEVMAQGAGTASITRAVASDVAIAPAALNLAIVAPATGRTSLTRVLTIANHAAATRSFTLANLYAISGVTLEITPAQLDLAPGASGEVSVKVSVDHPLPDPGPTFSYGGWLRLTSGNSQWNVPWAFVYSARATTTFDGVITTLSWSGVAGNRAAQRQYTDGIVESLLPPGTYASVLTGRVQSTDVIVATTQQHVTGDVTIPRSIADAPHTVRLLADDENGTPLNAGRTYRASARVLLPGTSIEIPALASRTLRVSPLGADVGLLVTESAVDEARREVIVAQHPALRDLASDRDLYLGASDYDARNVTVTFPSAHASRVMNVIPRAVVPNDDESGRSPLIVGIPATGTTWNARVVMTRETDPRYASGVSMYAFERVDASGGPVVLGIPTIRRDASGFFATNAAARPALPVAALEGEDFAFGEGALRPFFRFEPSNRLYVTSELYGTRGDSRRKDRARLTFSVKDASGAEVVGGATLDGVASAVLPADGTYTLQFDVPATLHGIAGNAKALMGFDTRRADSVPPNLTSLAFLDSTGRHVTRATASRPSRLVFSAGDFAFTSSTPRYLAVDGTATRAWWKRRGDSQWQPLAIVRKSEDPGTTGSPIPAPGIVYEADLTAVTTVATPLDLRIDLRDAAGNTMSWTLEPALPVDAPAAPARRRVAR